MNPRPHARWRSAVACVLIVSMALSGCALRRDASVALDPQEAAALQMKLDSHPRGTPVSLRLNSGERVDGLLVETAPDTVSVEVKARAPLRVIARTSIVGVSDPGPLARVPAGGRLFVVAAVAAAAWAVVWTVYWLLGKACESSDGSC